MTMEGMHADAGEQKRGRRVPTTGIPRLSTPLTWEQERELMMRERLRMVRELSTLRMRAGRAHDNMIAAQARAKDAAHKLKEAKGNLERCERDARRYQWARKIGMRFVGIARWLHERDIDAAIDEAIGNRWTAG